MGSNAFVYCLNSPINRHDSSGQISALVVVAACYAVVGIINNAINYNLYANIDEESSLTSSSYTEEKPTRKEKLAYTKQQTGEEVYSPNAWRYYSEYSLHEYAWYATSWADGKKIPLISEASKHAKSAEVDPEEWDIPIINFFTALWGILGF